MTVPKVSVAQAVTVSLKELENGTKHHISIDYRRVTDLNQGTVSFDTLTEAFGLSSLGIIIVKDLPENFIHLRKQVLSNASHLASLPESELSTSTPSPKQILRLKTN